VHGGVSNALGDTPAVGLRGDRRPALGPDRLTVGRLDRGSALRPPLPGEEALNGPHQAVAVRRKGLETWLRSGVPMAVSKHVSVVAHDAHVHGAGVPVEAPVKSVWRG
jgi:hypothetical protein